ncbi:hypothetical protein ANANG_G00142500 [Anguilla anguilla]|uniref:Uncharacterized protein n=1 Tax=Anguilla anguilla TaxID=7936 RepID=A0A9D3MB19_ANGAN|nr:hypothetical protein ANANG_G00142500 [Anguilla anguilla]
MLRHIGVGYSQALPTGHDIFRNRNRNKSVYLSKKVSEQKSVKVSVFPRSSFLPRCLALIRWEDMIRAFRAVLLMDLANLSQLANDISGN